MVSELYWEFMLHVHVTALYASFEYRVVLRVFKAMRRTTGGAGLRVHHCAGICSVVDELVYWDSAIWLLQPSSLTDSS